jgi:hypothetical protein
MDPSLVRVAVDPLSAWMPPLVTTVFMLGFAFAWWRLLKRQEASREVADTERYEALAKTLEGISKSVTDMRVLIAGFVTVERHSASVAALHEKINALALEFAEFKGRR